jgi:cell wall-associated NlpC family hydrolase
MTDLTEYIGIPFKFGGRDRNNLDCYGLVMLLYKELHGITLPDVISPTYLNEIETLLNEHKVKWEPCELEVGCVLVFNVRGYGSHVGYYLGDDRMIHTWEGTGGVMIERIAFSWKNRLIGSYKWKPKTSS